MTLRLVRTIISVLALALAASACASGDLEQVQRELEGKETNGESSSAASVRPPPAASSRLTGRVGLIVATNSPSWNELLGTPDERGVAVLYVQPDGPADDAGLKRGDLIVEVDGKPASNADRAVVLLRGRPDERRSIQLAGGRTITAVTKVPPKSIDLRAAYTRLIEDKPEDPVLYFLRSQAEGSIDDWLADADKAVALAPSFVEAVSRRAEIMWNRAGDTQLEASKVEEFRDKAISDWDLALRLDDDNTRVLVSRSQALAQRGNAARARRDAERAIDIDETFPRAYYALALADVQLGRYEQAAKPARTAIELDPFDVRYYRALAVIFMRLDRRADATRTVDAIIGLVEDQPTKDVLRQVLQDTGRSSSP